MKYLSLVLAIFVGSAVLGLAQATNEKGNKNNFCRGCKSIISYARTLNSTKRENEYKEALKSFCELYYLNSTDYQQAGPCSLFVRAFYHWLSLVDPVHHCDQIGACGRPSGTLNNLVLGNNIYDGMSPKASNVICEFCEQAFQQIQKKLSDPKVVDNARHKIEELCKYMGIVGQDKECLHVLRNYLDQAVDFIKGAKPIQYCRAVQLCYNGPTPASTRLVPQLDAVAVLSNYKDFGIETDVVIGERPGKQEEPLDCHRAPNCALCKRVVRELFNFIKGNRTEKKIEEGLERVCKLAFKGDKLQQCESMVQAYYKEIIQMVIDETDPELICMMLEQCTCKRYSDDLKFSTFISKLDPTVPINSARTCVECKFFINYLQGSFEDPKTQSFVRDWLLKNLCANLAEGDLKDSCNKMVNKYSEAFFQAIAQRMDSGLVCHDLGACKHAQKTLVFDTQGIEVGLNNVVPTLKNPQVKKGVCEQCIDTITKIDKYLSSHPIDQDVADLINNVCYKLPNESARNICAMIVKTLGSDITTAIASMENPRQLCSDIKFC